MRLILKEWLVLTFFLTGAMLGQSLPSAQGQSSVASTHADNSVATPNAQTSAPAPSSSKHKLGPLEISVNWRTRAEGWNWFQGDTGNSDYGLWNSLLRVGIGQTRENFDWFIEGEQPSILGLPNDAVVAAPQGQLGLGGTYYAANNNHTNEANGFLKQAFVNFKHLGPAALKFGRFEYFDGAEVKPKDPMLATVIQTRVASRLISNFGFSAAQRAFDGVQFSLNSGQNNLTLFGARPTEGVFQVRGMDELDVDIYSGAYTRSVRTKRNSAELRVFAMGYIDDRTVLLKTDNRPQKVRAGDQGKVEIATYGLDYVHVYNAEQAGKFDFLVWGALQNGSWGNQTQHAAAFVGEAGWQLPVMALKPWISAGYSYGSGDGDPNNGRHSTFFQLLPTPRQYARFPFYNMMNNEDLYATLNVRPLSKLSLRSEGHTLRLASTSDLWYLGGGAFQPNTFGYTGRPSNGNRGLANVWDLSADYQVTSSFSATLYYGHAWGKGVVDAIYPKDANGQLIYLETNYHF
ncbi:MAG: alginate export family protein [Candidatus Sulfotelmatobacter sp.]